MFERQVAVIIAAYRARDTIGAAIASALVEPEVAEVIVVDDASPDDTVAAAQAADDGSGRLTVLVQPVNRGPSAARNRALDHASAAHIAILDADDRFLPGRFAAMFAQSGWDIIADDIVFTASAAAADALVARKGSGRSRALPFDEFVARNIPAPGAPRAELGFLKPVMSRAFLDRHRLRYDEAMRLGEDFILYARALAAGAQFMLVDHCGYAAIQRPDSLSGRHATSDLAVLRDASEALQTLSGLDGGARALLRRHARNLAVKTRYRQLLDDRHSRGAAAALARLAADPGLAVPVMAALARDRFGPPPAPLADTRYLFHAGEFG